ncbi:hypothetical protein B5F35_12280 [Anaeromassilibacillus sp. An200]|nr:hypothetical protein B5F35_12280 [Anaeromassilibacillus sp. An200]
MRRNAAKATPAFFRTYCFLFYRILHAHASRASARAPLQASETARGGRGRHPKPGKIPRGGEKWDNSACFRRRAPVWGSLVRRAQNSGENRPHSPLQGVEKMIEFIQCSLDAGPVCQAYPNNP